MMEPAHPLTTGLILNAVVHLDTLVSTVAPSLVMHLYELPLAQLFYTKIPRARN